MKITQETSSAAKASIKPDSKTLRDQVYKAIAEAPDGLTDEQIQDATGMNPNTQRPRRLELYRDERITHKGKRPTKSGRAATVWVINQPLIKYTDNANPRVNQGTATMDYMEVNQRDKNSDATDGRSSKDE